MPSSTLSVFSESYGFHAAQLESGVIDLVVTGRERFWARLSRVSLCRMRLFSCEERQARIAFLSLPSNVVRVTRPVEPDGSLTWGGTGPRSGVIVTHSGGGCFHERVDGSCRWSTLWLRAEDLAELGGRMTGCTFAIPVGQRSWRPRPRTLRSLTRLHAAAIRATATRPELPVQEDAARGLEQELLIALIECLVEATANDDTELNPLLTDVMIRLEDVFRADPLESWSVANFARVLGVSNLVLEKACHLHLGMPPSRYIYFRRMGLIRRALLDKVPAEGAVGTIARLYGFHGRTRFVEGYRELFGELPCVTLRHVMR
jgi:AraC-like DNA-binding protein